MRNETQRNDLGNENKELESEWKGKPLGNRDKMCVTAFLLEVLTLILGHGKAKCGSRARKENEK